MTWMQAVIAVLVVVTGLHVLLTVALIRRVAQIAAGQTLAPSGPAIASPVGPVAVRTLDGEDIEEADLSDAVIAVLSKSCHSCEDAAERLSEAIRAGTVRGRVVALVLAGDGSPPAYARELGEHAEVYTLAGQDQDLLIDQGIRMFPYYLRTDGQALIRAAGPSLSEVADAPRPAVA